jgi:hypothetical protein
VSFVSQGQDSGPRHGLSFIALLSFTASFLSVRVFATLFPGVVVVQEGIHFHHFWVGIALLSVAGWLAISWRRSAYLDRIYAIAYGVGAGLIGDEVGLLLTLGNYSSELTYVFFIGALSFATLALLLLRFWKQVYLDVVELERGERLTKFGVFSACLSAIFATFSIATSITFLIVGIILILIGRNRKKQRARIEK